MKSFHIHVLPPLVLIVLIGVTSEALTRVFHIPPYLFPSPIEVLRSLFNHFQEVSRALGATALAALIGLSSSALGGAIFALLLSLNAWIRRAFYPLVVFFQTVPIIAIAPMMVIWVGYGFPSILLSAFIVSVSPIIANTLEGLLSADPALIELFRLKRASPLKTLFLLRIPSAIPQFLTGLRIASGLAVIGAIVGEFVADTYDQGGGIGTLIVTAIKEQETALVFASILGSTLLGLAFFMAVGTLTHFSLKWMHLPNGRIEP